MNGGKKAALAVVVVAAIGFMAYVAKRNGWHKPLRKAVLSLIQQK